VAHFVDICVCFLGGRDGNVAGFRVVGETLLVGVEFVARGAGLDSKKGLEMGVMGGLRRGLE
jgi:hypothetical protein